MRAIVDYAIEVNRSVQTSSKDLASVKAYLRDQAQKMKRSNVRFEGRLGVAQVVVPNKPFVRVRKGMHPLDLKKVLPPATFRGLFVERTFAEPTENYEVRFADLSPSQRLVVESYVEVTPALPRVNLPE
jgi:hypothetical protein